MRLLALEGCVVLLPSDTPHLEVLHCRQLKGDGALVEVILLS